LRRPVSNRPSKEKQKCFVRKGMQCCIEEAENKPVFLRQVEKATHRLELAKEAI
jgi:hypothetical protein